MTSYSMANSLSPMMFRKPKVKNGGTGNERKRSRSLENILDESMCTVGGRDRRGTALPSMNTQRSEWSEIPLVKSTHPVVTCLLPALSMDMVCSALMAVGATPLITEDPEDMEKDLQNSKAVLVDTGAPRLLIEAFLEHYVLGQCPLILVASQAGCNDRKKQLALQIIEDLGPSVITGSMADIYAISLEVLQKGNSLDSDSESNNELCEQDARTPDTPKVILGNGDAKVKEEKGSRVPAAIRRARMKVLALKHYSPTNSPSPSPRASPRTSPRTSPTRSPRGVRRKLCRGGDKGRLHRVPTVLPRMRMKGQFRDGTLLDISVEEALAQGQLLAAHTDAFVHLYETNVVTSGELIVEVANNQLGMGTLHSTLPTSGAIMAAVLACVEAKGDDLTVKHCSHALALFYVAAEKAAASATQQSEKGLISPGALRKNLIDALYELDEPSVRLLAQVYAHSSGTKTSSVS